MAYDAGSLLHAAVELMRVAPARPLVAIAVGCGVSPKTLLRAFQRSGAASAAEMRNRLLHEHMNALMTAVPPKSIKEISDAMGFATPQSFARWLKRTDGVAPTALRAALCRRQKAPSARRRGAGAGTLGPHVRGEASYG